MKQNLFLILLAVLLVGCGQNSRADMLKEAAQRITDGKAVLVDVRESSEWSQTGVAEPAVLLAKSRFDAGSPEWKSFLDQNRNREIILMCRSGNRSGQVARVLSGQGFTVTNLGGFSTWQKAGLPVRRVP